LTEYIELFEQAHGCNCGWWFEPVLGSLTEIPLLLSATILTAFNDNAAITYLSTLVPGFTDSLKYAVVAAAVTGGDLTVIANSPNPAGRSILKRYFGNNVSRSVCSKGPLFPLCSCCCALQFSDDLFVFSFF
jgi:hypothetical protein